VHLKQLIPCWKPRFAGLSAVLLAIAINFRYRCNCNDDIAYNQPKETVMSKVTTRDDLLSRMRANPALILVEALPEQYYNDWHLPRARHMPHDQVRQLAASVLPEKDAEIVVYCASDTCQNSHIAARQLVAMGYTDVAVYAGGKKEWSEAGLPVEGSTLAA